MFMINIVILLSLIASNLILSSAHEYPKIRRAGSMTMYPFPRVGRSQQERTWLTQESSDIHDEMKRAYLIPFPRVGRAMYDKDGKRARGDTADGMWFGPRLGRVSKRNYYGYNEDIPWAVIRDAFPNHFASKDEGQSDEEQAELTDQTTRQNVGTQ